jgi:hypothetical protein
MNNKLKPALLGGLIVGILSAIPLVQYCCCIWAIGGGVLAAFLYVKSSSVPVRTGDGAVVGALAGVVGGIIYLIIGLPFAIFFGMAAMEDQLTRSGVQLPFSGIILIIVAMIVGAIFLALLATLGGVIGVAIFEKRKGNGSAPPPPANYGGTPGAPGSYGTGL